MESPYIKLKFLTLIMFVGPLSPSPIFYFFSKDKSFFVQVRFYIGGVNCGMGDWDPEQFFPIMIIIIIIM